MKWSDEIFNPMKQFQQQQLDIAKAMESPMKQFQQQQLDIAKALESPMKQFQQQQLDIAKALESPMKQFQQQQLDLAKALESPMKQFQQQQLDLAKAMESPMKQIHQQRLDLAKALESPMKMYQQQVNELNKILSSTKVFKANKISFIGGLTVLDTIIEDIQEGSNSATFVTQESLELSEILNDFIESYLKLASQFKNGYNAITNNKAILQLTALIGLISSILTIVSFVQGDSVDIQIHNNFEDVKIDTETEGNKVDVYIEKKELPIEPNIEKEDNWVSGGERT